MRNPGTWKCPSIYHLGRAQVRVNTDGSLRKHSIDGADCPGSGYNIYTASGPEDEKLREREAEFARPSTRQAGEPA